MNKKINNNLSIVIPTYNRAPFLDRSLELHIPLAEKFNIPIFVSDNASTDNTARILKKWVGIYDFLYVFRHEESVGVDLNFEFVLRKPNTEYVWLLGDTSKINEDALVGVLNQIKESYDLILLNDNGRVKDVDTQSITDKEYLMSHLGWNMTQMSSLIFSKEVLRNSNYARFRDTSFLHVGICFEYLAYQEKIKLMWNKEISIYTFKIDGVKKVSWHDKTLHIWITQWTDLVLSLPPVYSQDSKIKMIQDHNVKSKIFSFKNLILLRSQGFYSLIYYSKYRKNIVFLLGNLNKSKFLFVGLLSSRLCKNIVKICRLCKNKK